MATRTIEVSEELADQLDRLAENEGRPAEDVLADALGLYSEQLETTPEELKELKRRAAKLDQDLAEGRYVTNEQFDAYLAENLEKYLKANN